MTKQVNVRLDAETLAALDRLAGIHGGKSEAIKAALIALDGAPATPTPLQSIDLPGALIEAAKRLKSLESIARFARKP